MQALNPVQALSPAQGTTPAPQGGPVPLTLEQLGLVSGGSPNGTWAAELAQVEGSPNGTW